MVVVPEGGGGGESAPSLSETEMRKAQALMEKAEADAMLAKLRAAEEAGKLMRTDRVDAALHHAGVALRRSFDALVRDLHRLVGKGERNAVRQRVERERMTLLEGQYRAFGKHLDA